MTWQKNWLFDIRSNPNTSSVTHPTGHSTTISHIGSCLTVGYLMLNNVLLVPDFKYKLILISHLCRDLSCTFTLSPGSMALQDQCRGRSIVIGTQRECLYLLYSNDNNEGRDLQTELTEQPQLVISLFDIYVLAIYLSIKFLELLMLIVKLLQLKITCFIMLRDKHDCIFILATVFL